MKKKVEVVTDINYNDYFYVPQCVALISKFPYVDQMRSSLFSILNIASQEKTEVLLTHLIQLIEGITVPTRYKQVSFYLPYVKTSVNLDRLLCNEELPLTNFSFNKLFQLLNPEMILNIFHLLLLEQKILFIGNDYNQISEIIDLFTNLLYPLE